MCGAAPEMHALGATLVAVGNGQPWQAAAFRDAAGIPFALFVDPSLHSYRAAGLRRSWLRIFHPRVFAAVWRARRTGARQTELQGDALQLGGVLVFTASGQLGWRHVGRFPGDHAAPEDILRALRRLA